jgi:hypothetical protein
MNHNIGENISFVIGLHYNPVLTGGMKNFRYLNNIRDEIYSICRYYYRAV